MVALLLALAALQDPAAARAESLLAAGDVRAALGVAERLVARHPRDADAHLLLGWIHFARPVIGRYQALEAFRAAARLAPSDPRPLDWQIKVGFYLGSDEGDWIAREAMLRLFALTPDYGDSWARFQQVYRGPGIWRRAERALRRHADDLAALGHRAELLLALEEPARADSLLGVATGKSGGSSSALVCLLRAQANVLAGRDAAGYAWHDSAIARADADAAEALWGEASAIASPDESARYAATWPSERRQFFVWFWARRDPNLVTPENERVGEHYRRLAEARRIYRLLHPQRSVYRSAAARALAAHEERQRLSALALQTPQVIPGGMSAPGAAWSRVAALPLRELQDTALPLAYGLGFDARGLVFLRHGPPDERIACIPDLRHPVPLPGCVSALDAEGWLYRTPDGPRTVSFSWSGEFFAPVSGAQVWSTQELLRSDRSALPAPLELRGWTAFFQSAQADRTDAYFRSVSDTAAVALWDAGGDEAGRARGAGPLALAVPAGIYEYGYDADSAGTLGRMRGTLTVPEFSAFELGLSSLVLASPPPATPLDREAALRGMPADLVYGAGAPLAAYAEVYGLVTARDGRSHYRVRYTFEPIRALPARLFGGRRPVVFEFDREGVGSRAVEQLVIEPDKVPAGRYRVRLAVTDLLRNVKSESVALEVTIR